MDLLGVDVGFSEKQKSTGIACLCRDELTMFRANSTWEDRTSQLPKDFYPSRIAVDGPLLPFGPRVDGIVNMKKVRICEQFFSRGKFTKRCKPGLSHFGTGFELRQAAHETAYQFGKHYYQMNWSVGHQIVEAFPNLFLGVLVSEDQYAKIPELRRGQKFDWLYEQAKPRFQELMQYMVIPDVVYDALAVEYDHELRAALICLVTAGLAAANKATRAGSDEDGWFYLPPIDMWEPWAIEAAETNFNWKVK